MNIAVAQSGGPTCAINASLAGVVKEALQNERIDIVYGSTNGIEGILNNQIVNLNEIFKTEKDFEILKQTPATVLGSCRHKLPHLEDSPETFEQITEKFKELNIGAFFYIGGNDSMDTVNKLSKYFKITGTDIKVMGIPKTIDNDLQVTDHSPGFGSAAKFVATTMREIARDSSVYDLKSVTIVEIMGRHAGWLAASSAVLHALGEEAPHLVYLPECDFSIIRFLTDITKKLEETDTVIVAVSEGVRIKGADYMSEKKDNFGHAYLSGIGKYLEDIVSKETGCKVRSIELNVLQRSASHINSLTDIDEAEAIGAEAVKTALSGETGKMMCFKRVSNNPYTLEFCTADAILVANSEKPFPREWINDDCNNIKNEALSYFLPLIKGETRTVTEFGVPKHFKINIKNKKEVIL